MIKMHRLCYTSILTSLLCLPATYATSAEDSGCTQDNRPRILLHHLEPSSKIWAFKDKGALQGAKKLYVSDFENCQEVLDFSETHNTLLILHKPSVEKVWVMRSGVGLTTDKDIACRPEPSQQEISGLRGLGDCPLSDK